MTELDPKWIRVSSVLSMIPTKDCDGKWGYPLQSINQDILQRKADLGSSVHAAIAAHCRDEFMPINAKEEGYLESYLKWEKEVKIRQEASEARLFHEAMNLTGCVDMIGAIGDKSLYVIDFKCTVSADPVKWPIQAALYHMLALVNKIPVEKTCLFVQLDKDGKLPKVHRYTITDTLMVSAISWYNAYVYLMKK
jgi:PD-(D/E)XK nuclease superfamily